jgi:C4-dicarboxylate-binding protein DctP
MLWRPIEDRYKSEGKDYFHVVLFSLFCLSFLFLASTALAAPIEIKFSHTSAEYTPVGQGAILFKKLAENRLAERVIVKVFPNSVLGNPREILTSLQNNYIEIAVLPLSVFFEFLREFRVFELDFLFDDLGAVTRFQNSPLGKKLLATMERQGYRGLAFWHYDMYQISANKPIRTPSDAKGLKIRVPPSKILIEQAKAIGVTPVPLNFAEVYVALQRGVVDGTENPWSSILSSNLYEVQKYITATNHRYFGFVLITNNNFWSKLSPNIKKQFENIIPEVTAEVNKRAVEDLNQVAQKISKSGLTNVLILTNKERQQWRQSVQPIRQKFENEIGKDIIEAALRSGTGDGGDPCPLGTCRCPDRTCKQKCCY